METTIMENHMETRLENEMATMALQSIYRDMGIMEKKMETTSVTTLYRGILG